MAKAKPPEKLSPPRLTNPREEVAAKLKDRIAKGSAIRQSEIHNSNDLEIARQNRSKWNDFNTELLTRSFDNPTFADQYNQGPGIAFISMNPSLSEQTSDFREDVGDSISRLESILEKLDLVPETLSTSAARLPTPGSSLSTRVFLVHGHDDGTKQTVARFLEHLGLQPVILHEQPNQGQTIIEKFERYAAVSYAVVLLTPDDVGAPKGEASSLRPRARQNVVLEMGFFLGALGRKHVCALYVNGVEMPSDYEGVLYVSLDGSDSWKMKLATELKAQGLDVDLNRAM